MHRKSTNSDRYYLNFLLQSFIILILFYGLACENTSTKPENREYGAIVEGINLDSLFAAPTAQEITAVWSDWNSRTFPAAAIQIVDSMEYPADSARLKLFIISQKIADFTHYSIGIRPLDATSKRIPLMLYCHGGDNGVSVEEVIGTADQLLSGEQDFFLLAPSFRSEAVRYGDEEWLSGGNPSTWNYDVDDALTLFYNCPESFPEIDTSRTGIIGISRGAGVALLMSIREASVDMVVDYFGPTNFFSDWVRDLTGDILTDTAVDLPGVTYLSSEYMKPLKNGELSIAEMRHQLLLRSPVYFHDHIPAIVIYHGTADKIVPVSQSEDLIARLETENRPSTEFAYYLYDGYGHDEQTVFLSLLTLKLFISNHF